MSYPNKLLPKRIYSILDSNIFRSEGFYLLRHTPSKKLIDENTDMLLNNAICLQSSHIIGYSLNLMGRYTIKHSKIEINHDFKKVFNSDWEPCELSLQPKKGQYRYDESKGFFFIDFNSIHNYPYSKTHPETAIKYKYICKLEHKPTKCNFWHFELHWYDSDGNKIKIEKGKIRGIPKKIYSDFRNLFKLFGKTTKPRNIKQISVKHYRKRNTCS